MASITRTAVRTQIREMLAEPTERHFTDCAINTWIDYGVRDVSIKTFCSTMIASPITTTIGCAEYTWPTSIEGTAIDTLGVKAVVLSSMISLDYISPEQLGRTLSVGEQGHKWTNWHEKIVLSPAPTAAITIQPYLWVVADQGGTAGAIKLPNAYHHLVAYYGTYMGHIKRLELDAAQSIYTLYLQELGRISQAINAQYIPEPMKEGVHDQGEAP